MPIEEIVPPPATLLYAKSMPALPPPTLRSTQRMLRSRTGVPAVAIADKGQSYNPAYDDWTELINNTASYEQKRLDKIAKQEWVPEPEPEAPVKESGHADTQEDDEGKVSFLGKPVELRRKTRAQRNRQRRVLEEVACCLSPY
jgi:Nop53 (60S ribosomal biogenesis)